jgi:hypothetical protein
MTEHFDKPEQTVDDLSKSDGNKAAGYSKIILMGLIVLTPVLFVTAYGIYRSQAGQSAKKAHFVGDFEKIYWPKLRGLDFSTGLVKEDLQALNGKRVAIPGFVVPLDDESSQFQEFLLVPSPKACIHVPPPPPNQMVMVRMKGDNIPKREWGPVWVKGVFRIEESTSGYGKVSFLLLGEDAEKYEMEE